MIPLVLGHGVRQLVKRRSPSELHPDPRHCLARDDEVERAPLVQTVLVFTVDRKSGGFGFGVDVRGDGRIEVSKVDWGGAAAGQLMVGDIVRQVNGHLVDAAAGTGAIIALMESGGAKLEIGVER